MNHAARDRLEHPNPRVTLDLDTLRTLVTADTLGGYGQAAAQLGRTPSAISLQMKRLQADVGVTLFRKRGRGLALTEAGELVLRYARRMLEFNDELLDAVGGAAKAGSIGLGCCQDFADAVLPAALARFGELYPRAQLEVRIEGNAVLVDAVGKGKLDLAIAIGHAERATAQTLAEVELAWIAGRDFVRRKGEPLPLVLLGPQCAFRKAAIDALDAAGVAWRLAAVSPSPSGLWAAARAGLGVTLRAPIGLPPELVASKSLFGLPRLGTFPVTLHSRTQARTAGFERLQRIVGEVLAQSVR
ncbi:LysR substrate-binding domain-containing protein [Pendulispora rubella]|uniref:LysR substrate-binding domain-containing protein n=1 Tax=Pendulispora rubella TaxID=2741070 RepID=A0ABZ2LP17_9BACT